MSSGEKIISHLPSSCQYLEWNKPVVFGRGERADIFINDDGASRDHVQLIGQIPPNGQVLFMTKNLSRSKGYNVNSKEITNNDTWTPLRKFDQIKIARLLFVVDIIPGRNMQNFILEFKLPHVNISAEIVKQLLQQYQDREGYVKFSMLHYLAFEAVGEWVELGRALQLEECLLTSVDLDYRKSTEKSYQMLLRWVYRNPEEATHEKLARALKDETVGRGDLAVKYCTTAENNNG